LSPRILFIGLDAVPDVLLFQDLADKLPNISRLTQKGIYGKLESCHPPITVPAWTVMMSSKDPGTLGIYGFRHRRGASYNSPWTVNSSTIKEKRVWEILQDYGKRSIVIGVPPAYPPYKIYGKLVSCFLTPASAQHYTYPEQFREEIESIVNGYKFDVVFRTEDRGKILADIYEMTEKRFQVVKQLVKKGEWEYFMFMEIGTDRLHHAFWKFYDKNHPKFIPNNEYQDVIPDYYKFVDRKIGELLDTIDDQDIAIIIASDHGTKGMKGAICINEWLIREGLLVLKNYPSEIIDIERADVDWEQTVAWGWGGYYARIFLNVKGREPQGVVRNEDYELLRDSISDKIKGIRDPDGRKMETSVYKPEDRYKKSKGDKPDLMVYFDDLYWRSAGTLGHNTIYLSENDTGPDDSVHSMDGVFIMYHPRLKFRGKIENLSIYDVAPTILNTFGLPFPPDMQGRSILESHIETKKL
jgi:predicted AlkP superfamily phosphohydrolase/phosphomutase